MMKKTLFNVYYINFKRNWFRSKKLMTHILKEIKSGLDPRINFYIRIGKI